MSGSRRGIIDVKSFTSHTKTGNTRAQAAQYAELDAVTLVLFVPVEDEELLKNYRMKRKLTALHL